MNLTVLKAEFVSSDWAIAEPALDKLVSIGGDEVFEFLVSFLSSTDVLLRNRASIALHDLEDNRAVGPLMQAITKKENKNYRGTMVYALDTLNCSHLLVEMFDLLFYGNAEVRMGAISILDGQIFEFDSDDLHIIKAKWNDVQQHPELCPEYIQHKEDIQHTVDGFIAYLEQ